MTATILAALLTTAPGAEPHTFQRLCRGFDAYAEVDTRDEQRRNDLKEKLERWARYALKSEEMGTKGPPYCLLRIEAVEVGSDLHGSTALHMQFERDESAEIATLLDETNGVYEGDAPYRDSGMRESLEQFISAFSKRWRR